MKIKIIQVGKNKGENYEEIVGELLKRLSGFCEMEIVTLPEAKVSKTFSVERAVEEEGNAILNAMKKEKIVIVLDERGREYSSTEFASFIGKHEDMGEQLCFVIGGAFGLSKAVKEQAGSLLSMSKLTLTHQMVRIFLLEQIYRAFCIIRGKEYHHD